MVAGTPIMPARCYSPAKLPEKSGGLMWRSGRPAAPPEASARGRLSRDTTDLLVIARDMQRAGAGIRSLAESFLDATSDFAEIIFAILGVAAKLERRRILERTARGRADAKANGVKFGRKPILTRTSRKRPVLASTQARRSAASPAATTSVRARFPGSGRER
jgi:Resolvase, N terminal domain